MSKNYKDRWNEKYFEFLDEGLDDQQAMDEADEYMEDYIDGHGDYLYEQKKDKDLGL